MDNDRRRGQPPLSPFAAARFRFYPVAVDPRPVSFADVSPLQTPQSLASQWRLSVWPRPTWSLSLSTPPSGSTTLRWSRGRAESPAEIGHEPHGLTLSPNRRG